VKIRIVFALAVAGLLAACSGKAPSPEGWQPVPGSSPDTAWSTGAGSAAQTYAYQHMDFTGSLQELASKQAVDVAKADKGARFVGSDTFGPCPGQAALASFSNGGRELVQGIAVIDGKATLVTYTRPQNTAMDPAVAKAMEGALCVAR
jgi:hypothetical protein